MLLRSTIHLLVSEFCLLAHIYLPSSPHMTIQEDTYISLLVAVFQWIYMYKSSVWISYSFGLFEKQRNKETDMSIVFIFGDKEVPIWGVIFLGKHLHWFLACCGPRNTVQVFHTGGKQIITSDAQG